MKVKDKKSRILFYVLSLSIALILFFIIYIYNRNNNPVNTFRFDLISPEGEYKDLQTANPSEPQLSDQLEAN